MGPLEKTETAPKYTFARVLERMRPFIDDFNEAGWNQNNAFIDSDPLKQLVLFNKEKSLLTAFPVLKTWLRVWRNFYEKPRKSWRSCFAAKFRKKAATRLFIKDLSDPDSGSQRRLPSPDPESFLGNLWRKPESGSERALRLCIFQTLTQVFYTGCRAQTLSLF